MLASMMDGWRLQIVLASPGILGSSQTHTLALDNHLAVSTNRKYKYKN